MQALAGFGEAGEFAQGENGAQLRQFHGTQQFYQPGAPPSGPASGFPNDRFIDSIAPWPCLPAPDATA
jgi:hypothetical protein